MDVGWVANCIWVEDVRFAGGYDGDDSCSFVITFRFSLVLFLGLTVPFFWIRTRSCWIEECGLCGSSMASSSRFASKSGTRLPTTPESKRKRREATDKRPRHAQPQSQSQSQENSSGKKANSRFEWPFPRRERESCWPSRKSQRHSVDRFFEAGEYILVLF